jgi:hypothetical protein
MLLSQNKGLSVNLNELILLVLSVAYAGISSNLLFGFRVVDILILVAFFLKLKQKIDPNIFIIFSLWLLSVTISTILGIIYKNEFIASDLRFFSIFIFAAYIGYSIGMSNSFNVEKLFYRLIVLTLIIYCIIPFFDFLRFFYIPESFQKDEHLNTIFGPSTIIINYLYLYLVLINKNRPIFFYLLYISFAIIIYNFRISRMDLALMLLFFSWSLIFRFGDKIKVKHILGVIGFLVVGTIIFYINDSERIQGLFNPSKDSSFVYRILSNNEFIKQYSNSSILVKTFGFGIGSTIDTYFNDWFGHIKFTLLDNGPLTVMMKTGALGLMTFIIILYYPLKGLSFWRKIIVVFPILLSLALFSHVIYNLLYILGFYFMCFKLRNLKQ